MRSIRCRAALCDQFDLLRQPGDDLVDWLRLREHPFDPLRLGQPLAHNDLLLLHM